MTTRMALIKELEDLTRSLASLQEDLRDLETDPTGTVHLISERLKAIHLRQIEAKALLDKKSVFFDSEIGLAEVCDIPSVKKNSGVPSGGLQILTFLTPLDRIDEVLGDHDEMFAKLRERFGASHAMRWFWWSVAQMAARAGVRWLAAAVALDQIFLRLLPLLKR